MPLGYSENSGSSRVANFYEIDLKLINKVVYLCICHVNNILIAFFAFVNLMSITIKNFGLKNGNVTILPNA